MAAIAEGDGRYNYVPDSEIRLDEARDMLLVRTRGIIAPELVEGPAVALPPLDPEVFELAREAAPGWDVRMIEQEWRAWTRETPKNPEMAFLGFCRKWAETRGRP